MVAAKRSMTTRVEAGKSRDSPAATTRTASMSSGGGTRFSTKPEAPARMASKTYSSTSKVVSTSTLVSGYAATMRRVASSPSMPGIRTSMRTTSGASRANDGDRLLAVTGLADDLPAGLGADDRLQSHADQRVVVDDGDSHAPTVARSEAHREAASPSEARLASSGSSTATRNPPSAVGPTDERPPRRPTRSRMPLRPRARAARAAARRPGRRRRAVDDVDRERVAVPRDHDLYGRAGGVPAALVSASRTMP